jgi:hypothetical protein
LILTIDHPCPLKAEVGEVFGEGERGVTMEDYIFRSKEEVTLRGLLILFKATEYRW